MTEAVSLVAGVIQVMSVVREQITRALATQPSSLEAFRTRMAALTYAEITDLWQQERHSREKCGSRSRPIMELRKQIEPDILNLIQQQRLAYLTEGTRFSKYKQVARSIIDPKSLQSRNSTIKNNGHRPQVTATSKKPEN